MGKKNNTKGSKINSPKWRHFVIAKFAINPLKLGPKLRKKLKEEKKSASNPKIPFLAPFCPKTPPPLAPPAPHAAVLVQKPPFSVDSDRGFVFFP